MGSGELGARLIQIRSLLTEEYDAAHTDPQYHAEALRTGFYPTMPAYLTQTAGPVRERVPLPGISVHLGSGNGGWALVAAVLGYQSFGIEANEYLVNRAQANTARAIEQGILTEAQAPRFACGNFFPHPWRDRYAQLSNQSMSKEQYVFTPKITTDSNPYDILGISLSDAAVIYCYPWSNQRRLFSAFLAAHMRDSTVVAMLEEGNLGFGEERDFPELELIARTPVLLWKKAAQPRATPINI